MRRRKKKWQQVYDELWDTDAQELARMLNIGGGVEGVAQCFGCSRWTVGRAIKAKGLRRGEHGKYLYQPPDPTKPDEMDDYLRMVDARPRRGPTIIDLGNAQEVFGGRRPQALSLWCSHEIERIELPDPLGLRLPEVVERCRHCGGRQFRAS